MNKSSFVARSAEVDLGEDRDGEEDRPMNVDKEAQVEEKQQGAAARGGEQVETVNSGDGDVITTNINAKRVVQADNMDKMQSLSDDKNDANHDNPKNLPVSLPPPPEPRLAPRSATGQTPRPRQPEAAQPGAVAVAGTALTRRDIAQRNADNRSTLPEPRRGLSAAELLEANLVSEEPLAVAVEDDSHKLRRYTIVGAIVALLAIAGLTAGLLKNRNDNDDDEPTEANTCENPIETLTVFDHCACFDTTEGLSLTSNETEFYQRIADLFYNSSVVDQEFHQSSCELANQAILSLANYERFNFTDEELDYITKNEDIWLQRFLLTLFFIAMGGDQWTFSDGWLEDKSMCTWYGVSCSFVERVVSIFLPYNNLNGTLFPELWQMPYWRELNLNGNPGIHGTIPTQVGNASTLALFFMGECSLSGEIPSEIGTMTALRALILDTNRLEGSIPSELGLLPDLGSLSLGFNFGINGTLPSELGNMEHLADFDVSRTSVSGPLPSFLSSPRNSGHKDLETVFLGKTMLTGTIQGDTICVDSNGDPLYSQPRNSTTVRPLRNPILYVVNCMGNFPIECTGSDECCEKIRQCEEEIPITLLEEFASSAN